MSHVTPLPFHHCDPVPPQWEGGALCLWPRRHTHLPSEAVQMEQGLQVSALPLSRHVEVCQPGLEGLLGGGEGCQVWEPCLTCPFLCSSQLGCLLGQFQALAVLGLRRKRTFNSNLRIHPAVVVSVDHEPQFPYLQSLVHGCVRLTRGLSHIQQSKPLPWKATVFGKVL